MSLVPYAASAGPQIARQALRYAVGQALAGAVEGGSAGLRKRVRTFTEKNTSGTSTGGNTSAFSKGVKPAPTLPYQMRRAVRECCQDIVEMKYLFNGSGNSDIGDSAVGTMILLNALTRGTNTNERVGNQVKNLRLQVSYTCTLALANTKWDVVRFAIVIDHQPNGVAPVYGDVFQNTAYTESGYQPNYVGRGKRFSVIHDAHIPLDTNNKLRTYSHSIPMRSLTQYQSNVGTISDINKNAIFLVFYSQDTTNRATVRWTSKLYFKDA